MHPAGRAVPATEVDGAALADVDLADAEAEEAEAEAEPDVAETEPLAELAPDAEILAAERAAT
ncbi:hypothetical protein GCM10009839_34780 [Catenulispora yoronensis]|uniref:Uncharacterized protein n=1 Tax=Catenulispora yoronensis TaxID=450799 RepID=A0ABN2UFK1_9ACTN